MSEPITKGEYRVGVSFNPSANTTVDQIKRSAATLIDLIEAIPAPAFSEPTSDEAWYKHRHEVHRLKALAQTAIEEGAMWAVKAATKPAP